MYSKHVLAVALLVLMFTSCETPGPSQTKDQGIDSNKVIDSTLFHDLRSATKISIQFVGHHAYDESVRGYVNDTMLAWIGNILSWDWTLMHAYSDTSWSKNSDTVMGGYTSNQESTRSNITLSFDINDSSISALSATQFKYFTHYGTQAHVVKVDQNPTIVVRDLKLSRRNGDSLFFESGGSALNDHLVKVRNSVDGYYHSYVYPFKGEYLTTHLDSLPMPYVRVAILK
jgi:hypothetical protein